MRSKCLPLLVEVKVQAEPRGVACNQHCARLGSNHDFVLSPTSAFWDLFVHIRTGGYADKDVSREHKQVSIVWWTGLILSDWGLLIASKCVRARLNQHPSGLHSFLRLIQLERAQYPGPLSRKPGSVSNPSHNSVSLSASSPHYNPSVVSSSLCPCSDSPYTEHSCDNVLYCCNPTIVANSPVFVYRAVTTCCIVVTPPLLLIVLSLSTELVLSEVEPRLEILPYQEVLIRPIGKNVLITCHAIVEGKNLITDLHWHDPSGRVINDWYVRRNNGTKQLFVSLRCMN
uniref:Ig-like domain-containing protein n=2 Tax=Timema TaxID=61471 RepID=A0A7R9EDK1_9NEOP|nr:unnamed protein product [Timema monikensis]